jgi:hypothetical protein
LGGERHRVHFFWLFYLGWIFQPCVREGNFNLKKKVPYGRIHNCVIGLTNLDSSRKRKLSKTLKFYHNSKISTLDILGGV